MCNSDDNSVFNRPTAKSISISAQNDLFRQTFDRSNGMVVLTRGVNALADIEKSQVVQAVRSYSDFNQDGDDPYCEHDFGSFEINNSKYFWKIDYYDNSLEYGSENPADPKLTKRVLTIMKASEY